MKELIEKMKSWDNWNGKVYGSPSREQYIFINGEKITDPEIISIAIKAVALNDGSRKREECVELASRCKIYDAKPSFGKYFPGNEVVLENGLKVTGRIVMDGDEVIDGTLTVEFPNGETHTMVSAEIKDTKEQAPEQFYEMLKKFKELK